MTEKLTEEGYPLLVDEENLLRQVHPDLLLDDGTPESSAFREKANHNYLMSTRREFIGAKQAYDDWIADGHASEGTWSVPIEAVHAQQLRAFDDSADADKPIGHASVDFRGFSDGQARKKAQQLRNAARKLYP